MFVDFNKINLEITAGRPDQLPSPGRPEGRRPQVAFSGRSNVGKSSLINALAGRKSLARVSSRPGKTITINFYDIDGRLYLVDLPGYGYAQRGAAAQRRFSELTDTYLNFAAEEQLRLVVQLVDCTSGPTDDDKMMIDWMTSLGVPFVVAACKADKPNKTDREKSVNEIKALTGTDPILVSVKTGEGIKALQSEIIKVL